ncbi:MAG: glycosyltransferase family 9 protein [Planctomycetota bacterium]
MRVLMVIRGAGIGDVITFTGCARSLKEDHGIETFVQCAPKGHDYCARNPWIAGFAKDRPAGAFDHEIDMMRAVIGGEDLADQTRHGVLVRSRIEMAADVWSRKLAVPVRPTLPAYEVPEAERVWARAWFAAEKLDPARCVAFQPIAKNAWRTWPRALSRRFVELVEKGQGLPLRHKERAGRETQSVSRPLGVPFVPLSLGGESFSVLVFHHRLDEIETIGGRRVIADHFWKAAAILSQCPLLVAVDSGLFHLAGALGVPAVGLFASTTGKVIAGVYPRATFLQGHPPHGGCRAPCHKQRSRGFIRAKCWHVGCEAMWTLEPDVVWTHVRQRIRPQTQEAVSDQLRSKAEG